MPLTRFRRTTCLLLVLTLFTLNGYSQHCEESFEWLDYAGEQVPDDLSYMTIAENPLVLNDLAINIFNEDPNGGASILNNTIRDEMLGGLSNAYVMSLNGDMNDFIHTKITFDEPVYNLQFTLVDIDRHALTTWLDSVQLKVYNATTNLNVTTANISNIGQFVQFNDLDDSFLGTGTEDNPNGVRGNVDLFFAGPIDSLVFDYFYGSESSPSDLGSQIIGVGNLKFSAVALCQNPTTSNDMSCGQKDKKQTIVVTENDDSGSGAFDFSTLELVEVPTNGSVEIGSDASICYTPNVDMAGMDLIKYRICNEYGLCDTAMVEFYLTQGNSLEVNFDQYAVLSNTSVSGNVLSNDHDPQNDALILNPTPVVVPTKGTLVLNTDGTFLYTPTPGNGGTDTFTYEVCDDNADQTCATAVVTIQIKEIVVPGAKSLIAMSDFLCVMPNNLSSSNVSVNDKMIGSVSDIEYSLTENVSNGLLIFYSDGSYTYRPDNGFVGMDQFTYQICGNNDDCCSSAKVYIDVNDQMMNCEMIRPFAIDDFGFNCEGLRIDGHLFENDIDVNLPGFYTELSLSNAPSNGSVNISSDGAYEYQPNEDFFGSDYFTYEVCTYEEELTILTEQKTSEDTPVIIANGVSSVISKLEVTVEGNISDINVDKMILDHLNIGEITITLQSPNGTVATLVQNICNGDENLNLGFDDASATSIIPCPPVSGSYYVPFTNLSVFNGEEMKGTWTLKITDNNPSTHPGSILDWGLNFTNAFNKLVACRKANAEMLVMPKVEAPVAECDQYELYSTEIVHFQVLLNDTDNDNDIVPSSISIVDGPTNGHAVVNVLGEIGFIPSSSYTGLDTITYMICDSLGLCSTAQAKILMVPTLAVSEIPLSIEMFKGSPLLKWSYDLDHQPEQFEIQKKIDGEIVELDNIEVTNSSSYQYKDTRYSFNNETLYKVVARYDDGSTKSSNWVSIKDELNFDVYPNPFVDQFTIELPQSVKEENIALEIFALDGTVIKSSTELISEQKIILNVSDLKSGSYYLRLSSNRIQMTKSVIKI